MNRPGGGSLKASHLSEANLARVRALNAIAQRRGQSLAQLALAWTLRDPRVSSALIGASRPEQIVDRLSLIGGFANRDGPGPGLRPRRSSDQIRQKVSSSGPSGWSGCISVRKRRFL